MLLQELRALRDSNTTELRVVAPAKASPNPQSSNGKGIELVAFFILLAVFVPLVVVYDRVSTRSAGRDRNDPGVPDTRN
jgi:hypothetical protein